MTIKSIEMYDASEKSRKAEQRKERVKSRKYVPHFKNWLAQKSQRLAQLWRFRNRITPDMQVREYRVDPLCKLKKPFACFRDMVREKYADVHMDQSRLDAMTALYLRCTGYTMDTVDQELIRHSPRPTTEAEKSDSLERRTRILQYAYGTAGDIDIAALTGKATPNAQQIMLSARQEIRTWPAISVFYPCGVKLRDWKKNRERRSGPCGG